MNTPATTPANTRTLASLITDATELGKQAGAGKDTQIKFYLKVFEGAYHGTVDLTSDKHGVTVDDAQKLTEAYVKAQTGATIFDAKAPNQRKATACVRTCIKGGGWTKGGSGEPLATANNLMNIRQQLRKDPANAKKLDDAGNTFLRFCRVLLKRDSLPDDDALRLICFKPEQDSATEAEFIEGLRRRLGRIKEGKGDVTVDKKFCDDVIDTCTKRLTAIAKAKRPQTIP